MGANKSLLLACNEVKVDDGSVESLFWDEKAEMCHKITTAKFDYYLPSDTGLDNKRFTLGGDEELKDTNPDECCIASESGESEVMSVFNGAPNNEPQRSRCLAVRALSCVLRRGGVARRSCVVSNEGECQGKIV